MLSEALYWENTLKDRGQDVQFDSSGLVLRKNNTIDFLLWCSDNKWSVVDDLSDMCVELLDALQLSLAKEQDDCFYLRVPTTLSDASIYLQLSKLLKNHPKRQLAELRESRAIAAAEFPFSSLKGMDLKVLEASANVWLVKNIWQLASKYGEVPLPFMAEKFSLVKLGTYLGVSPMHEVAAGDDVQTIEAKENSMRVAVSRMSVRAEKLIANAELGVFPSYAPVERVDRWRKPMSQLVGEEYGERKWLDHLLAVHSEIGKMNMLAETFRAREMEKLSRHADQMQAEMDAEDEQSN